MTTKVTVNGKDVTGRVEKVQALGPVGRVWVLDVDASGRFIPIKCGVRGRWHYGIIRTGTT